MATSSSTNYNLTRDDIIKEALELCGVLEEAGTPSANQLTTCARTLNILIKAWQTDGLNLWMNQELVMFPVKNQQQYTFAQSGGDRVCTRAEFITTQLNGAHTDLTAGATITVDSTTGMATSDKIGIVTDSGGVVWDTIATIPSSTTLTLTTGSTNTAADNDRVYTYTNAFTGRIMQVNEMWVRQNDGTDIPIEMISRQEYVDLSDKDTTGRANQAYFDPQRAQSELNIWPVHDDSYTNDYFYINASRVVEDFDAATDDADYPQEWYMALVWNLASQLAIKYGVDPAKQNMLLQMGMMYKKVVSDWDTEKESLMIVPDNSSSTYRR